MVVIPFGVVQVGAWLQNALLRLFKFIRVTFGKYTRDRFFERKLVPEESENENLYLSRLTP